MSEKVIVICLPVGTTNAQAATAAHRKKNGGNWYVANLTYCSCLDKSILERSNHMHFFMKLET